MTDLLTVSELENFEDKNGNGSYAAAFGHDDLIMTFVQLPLLKNTTKYKDFMEEWEIDMKATGKWAELEKEETEKRKLETLKQVADMMANVLQRKRNSMNIPQTVQVPIKQQYNPVHYNPVPVQQQQINPFMKQSIEMPMQSVQSSFDSLYSNNIYSSMMNGIDDSLYGGIGQQTDPMLARFRQFS